MSNPPNPLPCGCRSVGTLHLDGYGSDYTLVQTYRGVHVQLCPLHAQAEGMRDLLRMMINHRPKHPTLEQTEDISIAQALLRAVKGRQAP